MGSQTAQVRVESAVGAGPRSMVAGRTALKVVPPAAAPSPREQLRTAVIERLQRDTTELLERMNEYARLLDSRTFVATISQVISVSALAQELWKMPREVPAAREHLARTLGLAGNVDEATLVSALLDEVRQAFIAFEKSRAGRDFRERYDALLRTFEECNVLPIVLGYDVGPMVGELARLGLQEETVSGESLLLDERVVAAMPPALEAAQGQVWVSGASTAQIAQVVVQMRHVNPVLSNRQVRGLLGRMLTEADGSRKNLGRAELARLHDAARQTLRMSSVSRLSAW